MLDGHLPFTTSVFPLLSCLSFVASSLFPFDPLFRVSEFLALVVLRRLGVRRSVGKGRDKGFVGLEPELEVRGWQVGFSLALCMWLIKVANSRQRRHVGHEEGG